jgi:hypothetical protein
MQSTLRRGWYFGSQAFRERLLALLQKRIRMSGLIRGNTMRVRCS